MSMEGYLDQRAETLGRDAHQLAKAADANRWLHKGMTPEERLANFDTWCRLELAARIDWTWAGAAREKRIEQCRIELSRIALGLFRRGWLLDGAPIAAKIREVLDAVGNAQKKRQIGDFWAYFKASVDRYVGANAEELRAEAMHAGAHVGQIFGQLAKQLPSQASITELLAQRAAATAAGKAAKRGRPPKVCNTAAAQFLLFGNERADG